ncbi:MAG: DinB family protein [Acidimicrobiales bacterium]
MTTTLTREARDLLETLETHRRFLRRTVQGLTDIQLGLRTSVSELCLGGILKHVTAVERSWTRFVVEGPSAIPPFDEAAYVEHRAQFAVGPDDTVASLLADYEDVARATAELVAELPDLDADHPMPEAPWFEPGTRWSARRVLLHVLAETAQHAGHADIIREGIDGAKTMG